MFCIDIFNSSFSLLQRGPNAAATVDPIYTKRIFRSMQNIWYRALRHQSASRCPSCGINPSGTHLSRRSATTGLVRRKLNTRDAFTLLIGPVLLTATIADASAKCKRRAEWDAKIAATKAQVEDIGRGLAQPSKSKSRCCRRIPGLTRSYTTTVAAIGSSEPQGITASLDGHGGSDTLEWTPGFSDARQLSTGEEPLSEDFVQRCKRRQRLVALKLALRMMLHLQVGKSPRYIDTNSDYGYDPGILRLEANDLVQRLQEIHSSLKNTSREEASPQLQAYQMLTRNATNKLDQQIVQMARRFRYGSSSLTQLLEEFAQRVIYSSESPTAHGYLSLFLAFSRSRHDELSFMVHGTIDDAKLPYDQETLFHVLRQYGKHKDALRFDLLLKCLMSDEALGKFGERWHRRRVDEVFIPTPPSEDPALLQILVYVALKCNQPHRAEAWTTIMFMSANSRPWLSRVIHNFLKYYAAHQNWSKAVTWLNMALDSLEVLASVSIRHIQRVTFSMLNLCTAYNQWELYDSIMDAACESYLGVYTPEAYVAVPEPMQNIVDEWQSAQMRARKRDTDSLPAVEKAKILASKLQFIRNIDKTKGPGGRDTAAVQPEHVQRWRTICLQQQDQLDSLRRELRSLQTSVNKESVVSYNQATAHNASKNMTTQTHPFDAAMSPPSLSSPPQQKQQQQQQSATSHIQAQVQAQAVAAAAALFPPPLPSSSDVTSTEQKAIPFCPFSLRGSNSRKRRRRLRRRLRQFPKSASSPPQQKQQQQQQQQLTTSHTQGQAQAVAVAAAAAPSPPPPPPPPPPPSSDVTSTEQKAIPFGPFSLRGSNSHNGRWGLVQFPKSAISSVRAWQMAFPNGTIRVLPVERLPRISFRLTSGPHS